jgi:hypothetical protein
MVDRNFAILGTIPRTLRYLSQGKGRAYPGPPSLWDVEDVDMNKRIAGLLSGVAGLVTLNAAQAAVSAAPSQTASLYAQSYAELLDPIPNAVSLLIADDAARVQQRPAGVQLAQYHHHHHHHQFGGFGGIIVAPPVYAAPGYYGPDCYVQRQVVINQWGQRVVRRVRVCN